MCRWPKQALDLSVPNQEDCSWSRFEPQINQLKFLCPVDWGGNAYEYCNSCTKQCHPNTSSSGSCKCSEFSTNHTRENTVPAPATAVREPIIWWPTPAIEKVLFTASTPYFGSWSMLASFSLVVVVLVSRSASSASLPSTKTASPNLTKNLSSLWLE